VEEADKEVNRLTRGHGDAVTRSENQVYGVLAKPGIDLPPCPETMKRWDRKGSL